MFTKGRELAHDEYIEYLESAAHQTAFVFAPGASEDVSARPAKRRKTTKSRSHASKPITEATPTNFALQLGGQEPSESAQLRQALFERSWRDIEADIQSVLHEANEGTLAEVVSFVEHASDSEHNSKLPAGYIVTGPNIASQGLLFNQLSDTLVQQDKGPVILLRAGDASNLKNVLKIINRDSTNQNDVIDDEEANTLDEYGRKFLNYDLGILHKFVKGHESSKRVVVILQDSEAFDSDLLAELVRLLSSWLDRIPFVLLFGVATSVALFHERLPRSASRCLDGVKFDVENTSIILNKIFKKTIANGKTHVRFGSSLVSALMNRQKDHLQSVQAFITALKYANMCHFYGNALSVLVHADEALSVIDSVHLEAIRMLPSFRSLVEESLEQGRSIFAQSLLENDEVLLDTAKEHLAEGDLHFRSLLGAIHLLSVISPEPVQIVDLYLIAIEGSLETSEPVQKLLETVKRKAPQETLEFLQHVAGIIESGSIEMDITKWNQDIPDFMHKLQTLSAEVTGLIKESQKTGDPLRSAHAIRSKGLRTTVLAQRVQLTHDNSTLSKQDQAFTALVDKICESLTNLFSCKPPTSIFLHEAWLYDSQLPYAEVFTPRPRHAIETALTSPHDRTQCKCCKTDDGLSATQPTTAILYQMCLQAGALINIADLWSAFLDNQNQNDDEDFDEREALVRFYQGLSDLKQLGVVKQSKKKVDHLAKVLWKGL